MTQEITKFKNVEDLKMRLGNEYMKQINNYFEDKTDALKFLSCVTASVQRLPALLDCDPMTLINSFMTMAQLKLMPSEVSGEAYVLPYNKNVKVGNQWVKKPEAQFQLGYQGLVTLFYRAGVIEITAEIVYKKDDFSIENGKIKHKPDFFAKDRGEAIGAYVIVKLQTGGIVSKVMKKDEILDIGKNFSKSYYKTDFKTKKKTLSEHTPWNPKNDPQLHMWKKTVLKQVAKLVPKGSDNRFKADLFKALAEDNKESNINDRMLKVKEESKSLKMGALISTPNPEQNAEENKGTEENKDSSAKADKVSATTETQEG